YFDDEDDVSAEADFNNLVTSITVSLIPTTRVHKDHHVTQIIGDLSLASQTRSMTRVAKDQVARIEAIRLFLAYASFMGFMVYQMDVKSAFLYRTIKEEVYVCQPPGFEDPDYPDKVYKVVKALYGLHQAPRASGLLEQESHEKVSSCSTIEMESQASEGVASKPIKETVLPIALKSNVTRGQTSNDSGNRFERENRFGNGGDRFDRGNGNGSKGVGSSRGKHNCYGCGSKNHFIDKYLKAKMKKAFVGGAWSDSEDGDQMKNDATCLMVIGA
nr:putative ribonuclease H-like domain-containing protein [Tanacetum cinerariifolium]